MSLDQFYTNDSVAKECYDTLLKHINIDDYDYIVEPSAGKGAFFKLLPHDKRIGLDLEPKFNGIVKQDYFDFEPDISYKYGVVGNPPFGKISSAAVSFFNKSAEYSDVIAFIIPRTFKRVSIQNKLNLNFHLIYNKDLPLKPCCFEPTMSAKCSFQIWVKKDEPRTKVIYDKTHKDFSFMKLGPKDDNNQPTPPENADFAIRAYGGSCGEIVDDDLSQLRPKSWHWFKSNIEIEVLKKRLSTLDYSMSKDTVRQNSIGQQEVIYLYKTKYG